MALPWEFLQNLFHNCLLHVFETSSQSLVWDSSRVFFWDYTTYSFLDPYSDFTRVFLRGFFRFFLRCSFRDCFRDSSKIVLGFLLECYSRFELWTSGAPVLQNYLCIAQIYSGFSSDVAERNPPGVCYVRYFLFFIGYRIFYRISHGILSGVPWKILLLNSYKIPTGVSWGNI